MFVVMIRDVRGEGDRRCVGVFEHKTEARAVAEDILVLLDDLKANGGRRACYVSVLPVMGVDTAVESIRNRDVTA